MNPEFVALQAHAQRRKEHGIPNVYTEAEKDALSRKRERTPPPPTQVEEDDIMEEDSSEEVVMRDQHDQKLGARRQLFASSSGVDDDDEEAEAGERLNSLLHAVPDLREYFLQFPHMDTKAIISMLRAYASFLATQLPKAPPKKKSKGT